MNKDDNIQYDQSFLNAIWHLTKDGVIDIERNENINYSKEGK